jgi:hypothetical protein
MTACKSGFGMLFKTVKEFRAVPEISFLAIALLIALVAIGIPSRGTLVPVLVAPTT